MEMLDDELEMVPRVTETEGGGVCEQRLEQVAPDQPQACCPVCPADGSASLDGTVVTD
jgi:hypothetical protein